MKKKARTLQSSFFQKIQQSFGPSVNPIQTLKQRKEQAKLLCSKIVEKMDYYTDARSSIILVLLFFFLGQSLNKFLLCILVLYAYLFTFRFIRFWVKRCLMYMLDFTYFGNVCFVLFLLLPSDNINLFLSVFSCASGVISLSVIVDNNFVDLSNTDFITSTFLDSIPILASWAIRWKHILYEPDDGTWLLTLGEVPFEYSATVLKLIVYPFIAWCLWGIGYLTLNGKILRKFAYSDLYESTICKFYHSQTFPLLLGDHKKFTIVKYLLIQFSYLTISIPIVLACFYNFYFSCGYLIFIIVYLGINTARNKEKRLRAFMKQS